MNRPGLGLWKQIQSNEGHVEALIQEAPSDQLPEFEDTAIGFTSLQREDLVKIKSSQQDLGNGKRGFGLNTKVQQLLNDAAGRPSVNERNVVEICRLFEEYARMVCDIVYFSCLVTKSSLLIVTLVLHPAFILKGETI